jgi:hypothetical protein
MVALLLQLQPPDNSIGPDSTAADLRNSKTSRGRASMPDLSHVQVAAATTRSFF